jgi:hypothetical protein
MNTLAKLAKIGVNTNLMTRHAGLEDAKRNARSFVNSMRLVVMGCDGRYWVVSAREAASLRKAGYETI